MVIRISRKNDGSFTKNVSFMFIVYWGILVLWQNVSQAETRGTMDLVVKIGLLIYFTLFYLLRAKTLNSKAVMVMGLAMSLLITASMESRFVLSNVVSYIYPVLVLMLVYGLGNGLEINRSQLIAFCNCVIAITAYAAIYGLLFCWDQYVDALSAETAYGNELCSFFVSNFEYGMYLATAIISCVLCLSLSHNLTKRKKNLYICAIVLFSVNLIFTFSRTTIFSVMLFLLIYMLAGKGKGKKWIIGIAIASLLIFVLAPGVRTYVREIVFKDNNMADRDVLLKQAWIYYQNGTVVEKIFGHGISEIKLYFDKNYEHSNVHNSYMQVLLYYGAVGFFALVAFMLSQMSTYIKMIKVNRHIGSMLLGLTLVAALMMMTTTAVAFNSTIDSFFLTAFFILVPKYVRNSVCAGTFYNDRKELL